MVVNNRCYTLGEVLEDVPVCPVNRVVNFPDYCSVSPEEAERLRETIKDYCDFFYIKLPDGD